MSNPSDESIESIEKKCMDDYREHEGKILLANCIHGYVDEDSHEFHLEKPVRVQVIEHQRENTILNWTASEWCDPNWDVELLEPHEKLDMASSLWVDGISRNTNGRHYELSSCWRVDPDQSKPAAKNQQKEPEDIMSEKTEEKMGFAGDFMLALSSAISARRGTLLKSHLLDMDDEYELTPADIGILVETTARVIDVLGEKESEISRLREGYHASKQGIERLNEIVDKHRAEIIALEKAMKDALEYANKARS